MDKISGHVEPLSSWEKACGSCEISCSIGNGNGHTECKIEEEDTEICKDMAGVHLKKKKASTWEQLFTVDLKAS